MARDKAHLESGHTAKPWNEQASPVCDSAPILTRYISRGQRYFFFFNSFGHPEAYIFHPFTKGLAPTLQIYWLNFIIKRKLLEVWFCCLSRIFAVGLDADTRATIIIAIPTGFFRLACHGSYVILNISFSWNVSLKPNFFFTLDGKLSLELL